MMMMRLLLPLIALAASAEAQGIVTTIAGTDYLFPDDGKPALQAHLWSPQGLVFDKQGNLIIADSGLNMILKLDTKGVVSIVAGNGLARFAGDGGPARAASLSNPWGVAVDSKSNIYFADSANGRIRKIDTAGIITTVAGGGSIPAPNDGNKATQVNLSQPVAVAFDAAGNMLIAERGGLRIRSVKPDGTISTIAGSGTVSFSGDGGPATVAGLASPEGVAVAPDGSIYIADANNGAVRKVDTKGIITTFAGRGPDPNATGGPATGVSLGQPTAVAVDSQGNVYIAENSGNRARRVSPQGILTNLAGTGAAGFSGDGKSAVQATFASCFGIAVDPAGNVYISDRLNGRVRRVDPNGTVNTVAGSGPANGDGGPAPSAVFAGPNEAGFGDIAADSKGNIYVADKAAQRVRRVSPDGQITTIAGTGFPGNGADNIPATTSSLHDPAGLTIDNQGNLILADASTYTIRRLQSDGTFVTLARYPDVNFTNHVAVDGAGNIYFSSQDSVSEIVRKLAPNGTVTTFAGTSRRGFSGDGGPATSADLTQVRALAIDASGNIYISDGATRIRKVDTKGIITSFAGNGQNGDTGDGGPATSASLALGNGGLIFDSAGNLYMSTSNRIRRIGTDGIIRAWAGNGRFGFAGDGGPAATASFANLAALAFMPDGNLAVWDFGNRRVRLIQANATSPSIIASQNGLTFVASNGSGAPAPQSFTIVNGGTGTLNWGVTASTSSGGNWLSVTPSSGASPAGAAGPPVQVSVNPGGLAAGDYYGQISIQAPGAPNSPQTITVVLNVRAAGSAVGSIAQPSGLIFTGAALQTLTLTTVSTTPVNFTGTASFGSSSFFNLQPASGAVAAGKPATVQIVPFLTGLGNGVYNGNITFAFGDNSIANVQVLLVLSSGGAARPNAPGVRPAGCSATRLLPLFTSLGTGFNITTGWPSPVELRVVDDCGQPLTRGNVTATFSNTDPALTLNALGDGRWTGTWIAQNVSASVSVSAAAQSVDKALNGTAQVSGGLSRNANPPPVVAPGGVLNAASYQLQASLAPGSLISIFGSLLAQGSVSAPALPLTNSLGGTTVSIAGRQLPLLYAGTDQVNAMIPYDLPINATHQLVVQRGTAISIPQPVSVLSSQSGVFTKDLTGKGAGIVVRVTNDGAQSVVSTSNPTHVFEALVIYCAGLGDVDPRQIAGQQATFAPLSQTIDEVKVTIGGIDAPVVFAGLTPGFTGLYQVNAYVPVGVAPGDSIPLVITQNGRSSPPVSISVR